MPEGDIQLWICSGIFLDCFLSSRTCPPGMKEASMRFTPRFTTILVLAKGAGTVALTFQNARTWERDSKPVRTRTFHIAVQNPS
jgi:hypothetical protein